ncbi:hypothetical protein HYT02_02005 [Candidatus Gottesmanbacteria bacterium]|nr:hypothetical protein [Candidatus Gottesmanbacteria bacterium]
MPERIGGPENLSPDDKVRIIGTNIDDGEIIKYLGLMSTGDRVKTYIELRLITGVVGVIKQFIKVVDKIVPK